MRPDKYNDSKVWFDVQLPAPGEYTLGLSARKVGQTEFDTVLRYHVTALSDATANEPLAVPLRFARQGIEPVSHKQLAVNLGTERRVRITWLVPDEQIRLSTALRAVVSQRPAQPPTGSAARRGAPVQNMGAFGSGIVLAQTEALNVLKHVSVARASHDPSLVHIDVTLPPANSGQPGSTASVYVLQILLKRPPVDIGFTYLTEYELRCGRGR